MILTQRNTQITQRNNTFYTEEEITQRKNCYSLYEILLSDYTEEHDHLNFWVGVY